MKTSIISSTTIILLSIYTYSQIIIYQNHLPSAGDTIFYKTSILQNFNPEETGENYVWDFSQIQFQNHRADTFIAVSATPVVYNVVFNPFIANLACINQTPPSFTQGISIEDYYDFFKKNSSYFQKVGFGATINGVQTPVKYDTPEKIYKLPLTYGTSDSSVSNYSLSIPGFGYFGQTIYHKHIADGWGTIITPFGTYPCIRVKAVLNYTDTIFYEQYHFGIKINRPTSYEYFWLTNSTKGHIAKISSTNFIHILEIQYDPSTLISSHKLNNLTTILDENNYLTIKTPQNDLKTLKIFNYCGKELLTCSFKDSFFTVNLNNLTSGIYIIQLCTENSTFSKKILIKH